MKTHLFLTGGISFLLVLGACSDSPLAKKATGMMNEVIVVMDPAEWDSETGNMIKEELASDVPGLPQSEPAMRLVHVAPANFNGMLTFVRNIFIVNINPSMYTKVSVSAVKDKWASGQVVITVNAPAREEILEYLKDYKGAFVNYYTAVERRRLISLLENDHNRAVENMITDKLGIAVNVPSTMTYYRKEGKDFFWASNNAPTGRTDLIVYTFPYRDANTFTRDYLTAKRDSVMKINMPGTFPGSYMATENRYIQPEYKAITVKGQYCGELRGLWRMEGDKMGGPFVSHARLDESNNRVVVVEGFVYAPETNKRNYMRRIEAALFTLSLPGENTQLPEIEILPQQAQEENASL
jgi:hypothetical protein